MIEIILCIELGILGLIIIALSIHPHTLPDYDKEMGKLDGLKAKMKEMKDKMK